MYNLVLTDYHREKYAEELNFLERLAPEVSARKFPQAHVQQAFTYSLITDFVRDKEDTILCVGCHEDTSYEVLRKLSYFIMGVDPLINYPLEDFVKTFPDARFHIIFSTSVLEHVPDDEQFVGLIADTLAPGGVAILTCDYNSNYHEGSPKPVEDVRLYTGEDFTERLVPLIESKSCELLGDAHWGPSANEFGYGGAYYSFATFVFKKAI